MCGSKVGHIGQNRPRRLTCRFAQQTVQTAHPFPLHPLAGVQVKSVDSIFVRFMPNFLSHGPNVSVVSSGVVVQT